MAKEKTVYVCSNCGQDSPKWVGKCPSCGEWNTYVEEIVRKEPVNRRLAKHQITCINHQIRFLNRKANRENDQDRQG